MPKRFICSTSSDENAFSPSRMIMDEHGYNVNKTTIAYPNGFAILTTDGGYLLGFLYRQLCQR